MQKNIESPKEKRKHKKSKTNRMKPILVVKLPRIIHRTTATNWC